MSGAVDHLIGLKENVILGHLIPAGTGFAKHSQMKILHLAEPPEEIEIDPAIRSAREAFMRIGETEDEAAPTPPAAATTK